VVVKSKLGLAMVTILCGMAIPAVAASAATLAVNSEVDAPDASPGDGTCATSDGACTLRAAVMEANLGSGDEIVLPAGHFKLTIAPVLTAVGRDDGDPGHGVDASHGDLNVLVPMTIKGAGAKATIVDGNRVDRIFDVQADATISDLTVTKGSTRARELIGPTGGGAIGNSADLTLERVAVTNSRSEYGGGIFNIPGSFMTLRDSVVSGNEAGEAGGIRVDDKGLVVNSTITGNRVVSYRHVDAQGGLSGEGGGIDVRGMRLDVVNSTITRNFASDGGGGLNISLAYIDVGPPAFTAAAPAGPGVIALQNSIVAGNKADDTGQDCRATDAVFTSLGNNIDLDGSCGLTAAGDHPKAAPRLGRLRDNGGPTPTHALLKGSPAIDSAAAKACPKTDQRGVARPQGAGCDIGAFEAAPRHKAKRHRHHRRHRHS
jgi:hypothetical protein